MKITNEGWAIVERDTHIGRWVEEHKRLDFDQNALPQMLPHIKPGTDVFDIGANIGCYAYAFSKVARNVVCFEPNKEAARCLRHNLKNCNNIRLETQPLSDKSVAYRVVLDNDNIGMAYISEDVPNTIDYDNTTTFDNFIYRTESYYPGFIKIDVEGYELHVLRGGEKAIRSFKPVMVIEINDHTLKRTGVHRNEIFQWLLNHGYSFRNIYPGQGLQDDQLDIICFPSC